MARGLVGKSAERFFNNTSEAIGRAGESHSKNPFEGMGASGSVPLPRLAPVNNRAAPFTAEDAWSEQSQARSRGDSSNIVVDPGTYGAVMRRMEIVDNQAGADIFRCCGAIEEMCTGMYVVPETVPRVLELVGRVKNSLGQFRSLTNETSMGAQRFVNTMSEIDHGNTSNIVVASASAEQAVRRVGDTMNRQAEGMGRTVDNYRSQAGNLRTQAQNQMNRANQISRSISVMTGSFNQF